MHELSFFLEKFKNLGLEEARIKQAVIDVIKETTGKEVSAKALSFDAGTMTVRVQAHPVVKSELYIHREKIQNALTERGAKIKNVR